MTNSQRLNVIRKCLERWLAEHAGQADPGPFEESILIRDGYYCGRRFLVESHQAIWFLEEDELKISDRHGDLVCVLGSSEIESYGLVTNDPSWRENRAA